MNIKKYLIMLMLLALPLPMNAQVSFTSDEDTTEQVFTQEIEQDSTENSEIRSSDKNSQSEKSSITNSSTSSAKKYYSTDENEIVLYRDGKKVKSLPLHSASNDKKTEDLPMASVPSNITIRNDDFAIEVSNDNTNNASGSTLGSGSTVPEVVVGKTEAKAVASTSGSSTLPLIAIGCIAVIAGAAFAIKFLKGKKS